jgi:hypothetical protein
MSFRKNDWKRRGRKTTPLPNTEQPPKAGERKFIVRLCLCYGDVENEWRENHIWQVNEPTARELFVNAPMDVGK